MFNDVIFENCSAKYNDKILIIDILDFDYKSKYRELFKSNDFTVIDYIDDIDFRIKHEENLKLQSRKVLIICKSDVYIPYDIYKACFVFNMTPENIYPKLNYDIIKNSSKLELDLISYAYGNLFENLQQYDESVSYLKDNVYVKQNINLYVNQKYIQIKDILKNKPNYLDWLYLAEIKSEIDVVKTKYELDFNLNEVDEYFKEFILNDFGKLYQNSSENTPVLVSKSIDFITQKSKRFVFIVMDGMSEFDWNIISQTFEDIEYTKTSAYAMIPTTTAISRQCLLSNKYPSQLINPWSQSKEKKEYFDCMLDKGYSKQQIGYSRGYDSIFDYNINAGAVIINDIDDLMHAQQLDKIGMYQDIELLAKQGKLKNMVKRFLKAGYDVYISSDHGNSAAVGLGRLTKTGVEVETKSKKMLVLKDFADKDSLIEKYNMIEFPKYYLDEDYDYLICENKTSLDNKGDTVIAHGGISIEEVIVPFITIKREDNFKSK